MARGGETPFEAALLAAMPSLQKFAKHMAGDADRGEDLAQDALALALRYRDSFETGSNMRGWLCAIARNAQIDHSRKAWRLVEMPEGMAEEIPAEPVGTIRLELIEALEALCSLPPSMRRAMAGVVLGGLEYREVAAAEGVPTGTIKSLVSRGRAELRGQFA